MNNTVSGTKCFLCVQLVYNMRDVTMIDATMIQTFWLQTCKGDEWITTMHVRTCKPPLIKGSTWLTSYDFLALFRSLVTWLWGFVRRTKGIK